MSESPGNIVRPSGVWEQKNGMEHLAGMDPSIEVSGVFRKTAIITTIGPKTNTPEALLKLRKAGANVVRMNFSHGSHEYHGSVIDNLAKSFILEKGPPVAVALDTKGPEIRTGNMKDDVDIELKTGESIVVTTDEKFKDAGTADCIYVDYKNLPKVLKVGSTIYVDDGLISLLVKSKSPDGVSVTCDIVNSGTIASRRGVNLPGTVVDLPAVSEKDKQDLLFGVKRGVDMVFASFIRKAADVAEVRKVLGTEGKDIKIISKIESQEGVDNFDEILEVTDGVMVARGDLGIEIPAEQVFMAQKMMIAKCNIKGIPIICATQMLESMIVNPRPTRAEVSDVANAVLDGADCVMLSGETAKGKYPYEAVTTMRKICVQAEQVIHYRTRFLEQCQINRTCSVAESICCSAVSAAASTNAGAIFVLTNSGETARTVSKYRPRCPILVITKKHQTSRQCHLFSGCYAFVYADKRRKSVVEGDSLNDFQESREDRIRYGMREAIKMNFVRPGDRAVIILGSNAVHGFPNCFRVDDITA